MKKIKAKVLLSGGLDSMLAAEVLIEQGIEVKGVAYKSNFFGAEKAMAAAKQLDIPLEVVDISHELLEIVKNPSCGHGKNLNPCIDCHALMARLASKTLPLAGGDEEGVCDVVNPSQPPLIKGRGVVEMGCAVIATGEVLGQRPMSQNRQSLARVEKLSGGEILRPLSAKLLPETVYEKEGLVNRGKLLDIEGRGRERQMELAKKFGIKKYPSPAGGCLLTESGFCDKLREMITNWPECEPDDVELLKHGRSFWIKTLKSTNEDKSTNVFALIVVGRSEKDNEALEKLAKKDDFMVELKKEAGPLTLVRIMNYELRITNDFNDYNCSLLIPEELNFKALSLDKPRSLEEISEVACILTGYHAPKARGRETEFKVKSL
jgi:tRNA U34 2-thiouridine synthase MnmA/TrmU